MNQEDIERLWENRFRGSVRCGKGKRGSLSKWDGREGRGLFAVGYQVRGPNVCQDQVSYTMLQAKRTEKKSQRWR